MKNTLEKADEPKTSERACCRAATADCLACAASLGVDEYCYLNPDTVGCEGMLYKHSLEMFKYYNINSFYER